MPTLNAPVKTSLGQDELRNRTRGLGQRYRTVLLMVDGRRPLGDVLAMARQAGAQTSHFEELVRMGLVEVPADAAVSDDEVEDTALGSLAPPRLTSLEFDVFAASGAGALDEAPPVATNELPANPTSDIQDALRDYLGNSAPPIFDPEPEPEPMQVLQGASRGLPLITVSSIVEPVTPPAVASEPLRASMSMRYQEPSVIPPTPANGARRVAAPAPAPAIPPASPDASAGSSPEAPAETSTERPRSVRVVLPVRETPFKVADHARAAPKMNEEQRLQYVRDILLDTLRRDSLLFTSSAVARVRGALSQKELIKLVWAIERDRTHGRRSRDQLLNLQRARELLGMGNTLVAGESYAGPDSSY